MMHGKQYLACNIQFFAIIGIILATFLIPQSVSASPDSEQIKAAALTYEVPPALVAAIMENESHFDPNEISSSGCAGLGQICSSSTSSDIFSVQCPQSKSVGPQLCRQSTCDTSGSTPSCDTCAAGSSQVGCVKDQRFEIPKAILGSARVVHNKSDSISDGCDLSSEAGVKAVAFGYNSGQRFPVNAIADLGNCNNYADIWNNVAEHWAPTPACTIGGSECGSGTCGPVTVGSRTLNACTSPDGDIEGEVSYAASGWSHGMELGKLNRKRDTDPGTYVSKIYGDFVAYGGATPNAAFDAITIDGTYTGTTGVGGVGTAGTGVGGVSPAEVEALTAAGIKIPTPKISIPGLTFSPTENLLITNSDGSQYLTVPYLAEYLAAIYRFALGAVVVVVTIVIMVSGIQMMSPGNMMTSGEGDQKKTINQAKTRIVMSIGGLLLAFASYTLLFIINPELVNLRSLQVQVVAGIPLEEEFIRPLPTGELNPGAGNVPGSLGTNPPARAAVGDQYSDSDNSPIPALLGELPGYFADNNAICSQEAILYTIDALSEMNICVGPCHCAYAASHVVNFAGCNIEYTGGAGSLSRQLEDDRGWIKKDLDEIDITKNEWGVLVKRCGNEDDGSTGSSICHVGIYGGLDVNGVEIEFDSGSRGFRENDLGRYCPSSRWFYDIDLGDTSNNCFECSLIPARSPASGRSGAASLAGPGSPNPNSQVQGTNSGDGCRGIQSWATRVFDRDEWSYVLIAPSQDITPK